MTFIDFHTHHPARTGEEALVQGQETWGIHPWHIPADWNTLEPPTDILAIGECGLDKVCKTPNPLQKEVFLKHIGWSEEQRKPLLIHCVRALDDLLFLRHSKPVTQPWIFHGFRGKPQQLNSLLQSGFYVSFGFRFNEESLRQCPLDRLLLESDDDERPIRELYEQVSVLLDLPMEKLCQQMDAQYRLLFANHSD